MEDEGRTETEREAEEPKEDSPWAKTSSGDADEVTEEDEDS